MAHIRIQDENREIDSPEAITEFLKPFGIQYEQWEVEGRLKAEATDEEILEAYGPEIERLKQQGGYVTADVVNVTPAIPDLEKMLDKFRSEHTHSEDEVRFIVGGSGVFHINPENGPIFGLQLEQGDLINVPAGIKHWFDLCDDRRIRAIRLFLDKSGWVPHYTESGVDTNYQPLCFGPNYLPTKDANISGVVNP
ncbi:MAG: acireductone dioxygenase [Gemmataceae bacterium]